MNRTVLRARLLMRRPVCEWPGCQKPASEMHELIPRNITESNNEARQLSYAREIVSMLCAKHHLEAHRWGKKARSILLGVNTHTYSRKAVEAALEAVVNAMSIDIGFLFGDEWRVE